MNRWRLLVTVFWIALSLRLAADAYVSSWLDDHSGSLKQPLASFPAGIFGPAWTAEDLPLPNDIIKISGLTEYIHRRYEGPQARLILYVAYVKGGAGGAIHHPGICLPAHGFEIEDLQKLALNVESASREAILSEFLFHKPLTSPGYGLTTFYYNGNFRPERWRLQLADRWPGVNSYAIITLLGERLSTTEATRSLYSDLMHKVLLVLQDYLPVAGMKK